MQAHPARLAVIAGALFTTLALPAATLAQTSLTPIRVTEKQTRAEALDRQAAEYEISDWSKLHKAASLREEAAGLREDNDVQKAASLFWAARDRYYLDDPRTARDLMVRSGENAIAVGDVIGAAHAFTDAAYISTDLRDVEATKRYASRAHLLSNSPMLSDSQRDELRSRLALGGLTAEWVASLGLKH